jgi:purine-binding chemotaxis protein CheW
MDEEYLTFKLNGEEYGIDILCVQEIRVWSGVTTLPDTPEYLKGVINLRGLIVPIIDLRERFGQQSLAYGPTTVTIILNADRGTSTDAVGIIVDEVCEVYKFKSSDISPPPELGKNINSAFIKGMAKAGKKLIVLFEHSKLLDVSELYKVDEAKLAPAVG